MARAALEQMQRRERGENNVVGFTTRERKP
jgi:hypothetical protein